MFIGHARRNGAVHLMAHYRALHHPPAWRRLCAEHRLREPDRRHYAVRIDRDLVLDVDHRHDSNRSG